MLRQKQHQRGGRNDMRRLAPVFWLLLWVHVDGTLAQVEQPVEGFARLVSASNQGEYESGRGTQVGSSWENTRDGTQSVVWESAPVPEEYTAGAVTFAWSCGLARQSEAHELYLNDAKILTFSSGLISEPTSWGKDCTLRFEPTMWDLNGEIHGVMYLRVPAGKIPPGEPVQLAVRGP